MKDSIRKAEYITALEAMKKIVWIGRFVTELECMGLCLVLVFHTRLCYFWTVWIHGALLWDNQWHLGFDQEAEVPPEVWWLYKADSTTLWISRCKDVQNTHGPDVSDPRTKSIPWAKHEQQWIVIGVKGLVQTRLLTLVQVGDWRRYALEAIIIVIINISVCN